VCAALEFRHKTYESLRDEEIPAGDAGGARRSVLTRQQDRVVGEVKGDALRRKVGVFDLLGVDHVVVAVVASENAGMVGVHRELPDLEFFGGNTLVVRLNDRDFIEEPLGAGLVSHEFRAIGEKNLAVDPVAIPLFAARELCQVGFAECLGHDRPLSF
jgi:hypothetical protein